MDVCDQYTLYKQMKLSKNKNILKRRKHYKCVFSGYSILLCIDLSLGKGFYSVSQVGLEL